MESDGLVHGEIGNTVLNRTSDNVGTRKKSWQKNVSLEKCSKLIGKFISSLKK